MNKVALQKVQPYLNVIGVRPTKILLDINLDNEELFFARSGQSPSFSRCAWNCIGVANSSEEGIENSNFYSFLINTKIYLAAQPEDGPTPENQEIPSELIFATLDINFTVDYQSTIEIKNLDNDGIEEFLKYNVPYHFWPYWRELAQSLCLRAQIPLPSLASYRVPEDAQQVVPDNAK